MSYLLIENRGEAEILALTLMGASSKRDSEDKIGLFGTGFKNSLAVLLREQIAVTMFFGDTKIQPEVTPVKFRDKDFKRVDLVLHDRRIETGFTTDMGLRWSVEGALRDLVSNALDEEHPFVGLLDSEPHGLVGRTRIFIELSKPVKAFHETVGKHFLKLRETKPLFSFEGGELWPKYDSSGTRIYRHGVLVFEATKSAAYDYNIDKTSITEERTATEFEAQWQIGHNIDRFPKSAKMEIVKNLPFERFESGCEHVGEFASPDWKEIFDGKIACAASIFDGELQTFIPKTRAIRCTDKWEHALGSAGVETSNTYLSAAHKVGGTIVPTTDIEEKGLLWSVEFMNRCGYVVSRDDIDVFVSASPYLMGQWDKEKGRILISKTCIHKGRHFLAATLLEEILHRDTGFCDLTRDFQSCILERLINSMAESKGEYL